MKDGFANAAEAKECSAGRRKGYFEEKRSRYLALKLREKDGMILTRGDSRVWTMKIGACWQKKEREIRPFFVGIRIQKIKSNNNISVTEKYAKFE